jgi:hypothetical protein
MANRKHNIKAEKGNVSEKTTSSIQCIHNSLFNLKQLCRAGSTLVSQNGKGVRGL